MSEELKAYNEAIKELEKQYGPGVVMDAQTIVPGIDVVPTGIMGVDAALGVGGIPRGRITEIYGPEASAKTSLIWAVMGEVHRRGGMTFLCDMEHAADLEWAEKFGVDRNLLKISQPDSLEEALDVTEAMVRTGMFAVAAVDSIAALVPKKELEGTMEDNTIGLVPRLFGKHLRKITPAVHKTNTAMIYINQLRMNIGVMYGNPETTPGGKAIKYHASIRIEMRSSGPSLKDGKEEIGREVKLTVKKNKLAPPFRVAMLELFFDEGISKVGSALDVAIATGIVKKGGAWLTWGENRFQGKPAAKEYFRENPEAFEKLVAETRGNLVDAPIEIGLPEDE